MKGLFQCPPLYIARYFKAFALTGRVFKIRLKFGTFFSRIIGLTN